MLSLIKTVILFGILIFVFTLIGAFAAGESGIFLGLITSLALIVALYLFSEKLIILMSSAKPMDIIIYKDFYISVKEICAKHYLPVPKIYISPDIQANIFTAGRSHRHSSIVVTKSLFNILQKEELLAILSHEMVHIKKFDTLISSMSAVLASIILYPSNAVFREKDQNFEKRPPNIIWQTIKSLFYLAVIVVKFGIPRGREFRADKLGAKILGSGSYLSGALTKIGNSAQNSPIYLNPALYSLFICDPLGGQGDKLSESLATQPAIEERLKRLMKI